WKEHLHQMDQIRDAIGFRAFSQRDPRIEFKREAATAFETMQDSIHDKVTDVIFKGRFAIQRPQAQATAAPAPAAAAEISGTPAGPTAPAAPPRPRPAPASRLRPSAPKPAEAKVAAAGAAVVGRNEPCPCGSGKKFKQCHGKAGA
ncbi:MAG: SEC-C metal-binding domain-containing protein, partial [Planctomycetota bacterium]